MPGSFPAFPFFGRLKSAVPQRASARSPKPGAGFPSLYIFARLKSRNTFVQVQIIFNMFRHLLCTRP